MGKSVRPRTALQKSTLMTNAMLEPPMHPRKEVQCLGDMSKNDQHQTRCAE